LIQIATANIMAFA